MPLLTPSIFTVIEQPLHELLVAIHRTTELPWAWSIIVLTMIVRLAIFPITAKQTRSTLAMQRLQPYMKQLQQKHRDDRQALNVAMMEFYRDNNVNPLASCLPLLIQIPIFTALFFLLKDFKAPAGTSSNFTFLFGFVDNIRLDIDSVGAPGWILLAFYVASQMLSSWTMMNSPDPRQKVLFLVLPVLFVPAIIHFPIGVMLYWITTNLWSLGQYLLVVRLAKGPVEVVLPADSKGVKKVIVPKASKGQAAGTRAAAATTASRGTGDSGAQSRPAARRNKRRR